MFHIHIEKHRPGIPATLQSILPGKILCIPKESVNTLPEIIITTMQLVNGEDKEKGISQWSELAQPIVRNAVKDLVIKTKKKGLFF